MSAVQTLWARLIARTLADAGVTTCVISPGSRSTPLVAAIAAEPRLHSVSIIDERSAAFFALGAGRINAPVALICTSGSAAAHYLPAFVEAHLAEVPMIAITADRPPELHDCGASQTIDQTRLYGAFVRGAFELGAPVGDALAFRAMRAKLAQAIALARGPIAGPVHVNAPLRKPLEPREPSTDDERALAALAVAPIAAQPSLQASPAAIDEVAAAIRAEPHGAIVVGAMPLMFGSARPQLAQLAAITGYPLIAEAGSQLRGDGTIHHFDATAKHAPAPKLVIQIGAEPVAASWPGWARDATRVVLAQTWSDPTATAHVVRGEVGMSVLMLVEALGELSRTTEYLERWHACDRDAARALAVAIDGAPTSETFALRAAVGAARNAIVQIGNSLPIRTIEHAVGSLTRTPVITQRGAAGIDGLLASAAGAAACGGVPVLLALGDVSFAHDVGSLQVARDYPVVTVVLDNGGGQIFAGLPIGNAGIGDAFAKHFTTAPRLDAVAIAGAFGLPAISVEPTDVAAAVAAAIEVRRAAVIHVRCSPTGHHDVRRAALEAMR